MKKIISMIMILTLGGMILAGCSQEAPKVEENVVDEIVVEEMTINVAGPSGAPTLSMIKMFKENPSFGDHINMNYESVKSPDSMAARIISGEIDIAVVPTNLAASLYNRDVEYTLVGSSVWGILYMVGNEEINSFEDLKGKEIHTIGRGLTPDIVLRYVLSNNGIDPENDVTLTYMGEGAELASGFISGNAQIAVIPEPALSNVMLKKPDTVMLFDLQQEWSKLTEEDSYPQASLIIKNELIENHPEFVEQFIKEYEESINWLNQNPELAGEYSEELETGLSKPAVINGLERSNIKFVRAKDAKSAIEKYLTVLHDYQKETVGGKLPDEGFYYQK